MSVFTLIKELCSELIKENHGTEVDLSKAKRIAFEELLKRSQNEEICDCEKILKDLQFCSFELMLLNKLDDAKKLEQFVDVVQADSDHLVPILSLLLGLKNIENKIENDNFFQLPSITLQASKNAYMTQISMSQPLTINSSSNNNKESTNFLSNILNTYIGEKKSIDTCLKLKQIEPPKIIQQSVSEKSSSNKSINTWENLESKIDFPPKSFAAESDQLFVYQNVLSLSKSKGSAEINTVSVIKLINDIKLLMIGIESESFKRLEETLKFYLAIELSCEDISDLSHYVEDFLEMGTCFKRLKTYTSKNPFNQTHIFDGFIFKAFCDRVMKFLNHCRDFIYSQEIESLLELHGSTSKLRNITIHLAKFLNIHPTSLPTEIAIPTGSDFLRLLYDEYTKVLDNELKCFYIQLLKSCCEVYYLRYQAWIYSGQLDDPHKELFIYYVDHYIENTKYFFDKAYLVRKQSVPAFLLLNGCADNVLLCGKYTMLLKSFKPMHSLFRLKKPSLKVCLTFEELSDLKNECQEFLERARAECGEVISVESILNERRKIKLEKYKNAELAATRNLEKWKQYLKERNEKIREFREMQQQKLRKELEQIEERKLVKRLEEINIEREYMDECEEAEMIELEKENQEIREKIEIYQKLNTNLDKSNQVRNDILENLSSKLKSEDALNANEGAKEVIEKDDMNNIIIDKVETLTDAQKNKLKVMSHEYNTSSSSACDKINANLDDKLPNVLTEAQRNKLKVMGHEYAMIDVKSVDVQPKINVQDYDKMTDLQRNRLKVLSHEFRTMEVREETMKKEVSQGPMTALQKNRMKVLSHEFAYFDGEKAVEKKTLTLDFLQPTTTAVKQLESPMSVTSDHFTNDSSEHQGDDECHNEEIVGTASIVDNEDEEAEMIRAFEEAVEANQKMFMGIDLNESINDVPFNTIYNDVAMMDTVALSQFLQMSLTIPLNSYMEVLSNETLKMYVQDLDILSHFKSLRNYFLLMNGEFCSSICHEMFSKLEKGIKPVELLNYQSLHMMLDNALSGSKDPNTELLSFIVQNSPERFELNSPAVLNMVTLSYTLEWPLTLILNAETMDQYRTIFNYLLKLKRMSWILEECFQILKESHKQHGNWLLKSPQYRNVQHIRHQMTQFVNCLENYVTRNVMQTAWTAFIQDLKTAKSILCIYRKHTNYLKRILFLCLLNKKSFEFYKTIEDVFRVILRFHKHLKAKSWQSTTASSATYSHAKYDKIQNVSDDFDRLVRYVIYLGNKIIQHNYQKEIYDLLSMLDINGYYTNR